MTKASEVRVTRDEAWQLRSRVIQLMEKHDGDVFAATAEAMAEWLAARVPDAIIYQDPDEIDEAQMTFHNALRAAVLRGPQ